LSNQRTTEHKNLIRAEIATSSHSLMKEGKKWQKFERPIWHLTKYA
jgi:hypothetical protein